jgi:hypothetical protein
MDVIHFTQGATDPLNDFGAKGVRFLPLADGTGDPHVSCAHLESGATIQAPSITHTAALLVVHGQISVITEHGARINILAGMGAIFDRNEPYTIESDTGAIILIVESDKLTGNPHRIRRPHHQTRRRRRNARPRRHQVLRTSRLWLRRHRP